MGLFTDRKKINNKTQVPLWFMRQAGRYHQHYQNIKKTSSFMEMCKSPNLACEVTMGPIEEFDFDAAILFSDLLFPLEHLGLGLNYLQGPPALETHLTDIEKCSELKETKPASEFYSFQGEAVSLLKQKLPQDKTLLGFGGAPFTLYTYATEGAHKGNLVDSKQGLYSGKFQDFMSKLLPTLITELRIQAEAGADGICLFDTAAGELCLKDYERFIVPEIRKVTSALKETHPDVKIVYYSKFTHLEYLHALNDPCIDVLGVDWRTDIVRALKEFGDRYYIQGNIDPIWLHLPWADLEKNLTEYFAHLNSSEANLDKWIMGLGHGVTVGTPEENVKNTVRFVHENFQYS